MQIANVTATYDGDLVEDHDDVTRSALSSLLHSGDEITVHEVHDEEQIEDLKQRYPEWEEKVTVEGEDDEDDTPERIEAIDKAPGVDTATVEPGDVLEQASGSEAGARFRVVEFKRGFGDGGTLVVEPTAETDSRRDKIVDNGSGPLFRPAVEVDVE